MPARRGRRVERAPATDRAPPCCRPGKILFPGDGYTKQDVWDYYAAVMEHLLPEVVDRPLSIIRCPSGTAKPCFFQKHHTAGLALVDPVRLKEESGINAHYLVVRTQPACLNWCSSTRWSSTLGAATPRRPTRPTGWCSIWIPDRTYLCRGQESGNRHPQTAGAAGAGIVPACIRRQGPARGRAAQPGCDWDLTKRFAKGFADALAQSEPQRFLATATKSLRNKRIFVDYLRNGRGATAVASYSLRARPGAPVALPIAWGDLAKLSAQTRSRSRTCQQSSSGGAKTLGRHRGSEAESGAMGAGRPVARAYASDPRCCRAGHDRIRPARALLTVWARTSAIPAASFHRAPPPTRPRQLCNPAAGVAAHANGPDAPIPLHAGNSVQLQNMEKAGIGHGALPSHLAQA
jgi:hypothetical protein